MAPKTAENFRALCTGEYLISFYPFKIFYSWITVGQANVFLFFDMHFSVSHLMILFQEKGESVQEQGSYCTTRAPSFTEFWKAPLQRYTIILLLLWYLRFFFSICKSTHHVVVEHGLVVNAPPLVNYACLCCRIQVWWSRLLFLWYSFKVVTY